MHATTRLDGPPEMESPQANDNEKPLTMSPGVTWGQAYDLSVSRSEWPSARPGTTELRKD